jgi:hypothetical protein
MQIWDIGLGDLILTNRLGSVVFLGFTEEGLECQVYSPSYGKQLIPTSDIILPKLNQNMNRGQIKSDLQLSNTNLNAPLLK